MDKNKDYYELTSKNNKTKIRVIGIS